MKLSVTETLAGSIEEIFDALADFPKAERAAMERGVHVERLDALATPAAGVKWHLAFVARGREREADVTLASFQRPTGMRFEGRVGGLLFDTDLSCRVLGPSETEVTVQTKLRARSLSARVLVESLKLGRRKVAQSYRRGIRRHLDAAQARVGASS